MVRKSILVIVLFALLVAAVGIVAGCNESEPAVSTTQQAVTTLPEASATTAEPIVLTEGGWLMGISIPTSVPTVIERLGDPDSMLLPNLEEDPSPWPQQFRWEVGGGDYTFSVLADSYSDTEPDYAAEVYTSVLRLDGDVVSPELLDGVSLGGTTVSELQALLGDAVAVSEYFPVPQFDETGTYVSSMVSEQDGIFTFYLFNEEDVLAGIAQSTYDLGGVD
jgi:hypothetical protein